MVGTRRWRPKTYSKYIFFVKLRLLIIGFCMFQSVSLILYFLISFLCLIKAFIIFKSFICDNLSPKLLFLCQFLVQNYICERESWVNMSYDYFFFPLLKFSHSLSRKTTKAKWNVWRSYSQKVNMWIIGTLRWRAITPPFDTFVSVSMDFMNLQ